MPEVFNFSTIGLTEAEGVAFKAAIIGALSPGTLLAIDSRSVIFGWGSEMTNILGHTRDEMMGESLLRIMPREHVAAHMSGMTHYLKTGEGPIIDRKIQVSALHKDGHEVPIELNVSRLDWHHEAFFIARIRDITEQVEFERNLQALTGQNPVSRFEPVRFRTPEDQAALETRQAAFFAVRDGLLKARDILDGSLPPEAKLLALSKILGRRNVPLTLSLAVLQEK